jgi:hypothetical protein
VLVIFTFKIFDFIYFKLIFFIILNCFDILMIKKNKKNYFNIFLNKKYFKKQYNLKHYFYPRIRWLLS